MRRFFAILVVFSVAVGTQWLPGCAKQGANVPLGEPQRPTTNNLSVRDSTGRPLDATEPAACATGCAVGNHPISPLTEAAYRDLVRTLATGTEEEGTTALETLLFHGARVRGFVSELGVEPLAGERRRRLLKELSRTHARVWVRIIDERGVVRASVDGARFPVGRKEHVHVTSTAELQPPEVSGTVHRTGVHHLWTRL